MIQHLTTHPAKLHNSLLIQYPTALQLNLRSRIIVNNINLLNPDWFQKYQPELSDLGKNELHFGGLCLYVAKVDTYIRIIRTVKNKYQIQVGHIYENRGFIPTVTLVDVSSYGLAAALHFSGFR